MTILSIPTPRSLPIHRVLQAAGYQSVVVGGWMRRVGSGRDVDGADEDIATSARPDEVRALFASRPGFAVAENGGEEHGTLLVILDGAPFEVTTFRRDVACDGRHAQVFWTADLAEDLARRDFTCNAIAYDPIAQQVIDPFDGLGDLRRRVVRAVGNPYHRLQEDWLRLLRAPRMALDIGGSMEPGLERAVRQLAWMLPVVSAERRRDELLKMLGYEDGWWGPYLLAELGLLRYVLPRLDGCRGTGRRSSYPLAYDLFERAVLRACAVQPTELHPRAGAKEALVEHRLMALYAEAGADAARGDLTDLRCPKRLVAKVARAAAFWPDIPPGAPWDVRSFPAYQREFLLRLARETPEAEMAETVEELAALKLADGGFNPEPLRRAAQEPLYRSQLKVDGRDVMALGVPEGPRVGRLLDALLRLGPAGSREGQLAQLQGLLEAGHV